MDDVMDDVAHSSPSVHPISSQTLSRKRKADGEDPAVQECQCPPSPEPMALDTSDCPRNPSHSCWSSTSHPCWSPNPPHSPFVPDTQSNSNPEYRRERKRPRIQLPSSPGSRKRSHVHRTNRATSEVIDMGVVAAAHAGPSRGSLLRTSQKPPLLPTIDWSSPNIPSLQPIPNRDTLKELDLEAILRNPQLRHDLLFDSGLQFRPTSSRKKRDQAEHYWTAITRELETGCTCITWDESGSVVDSVCICKDLPVPAVHPIAAFSPASGRTSLRMTSRIRNLFSELLEVLVSVIQPLPSSVYGMTMRSSALQPTIDKHAAQAEYLRTVLDPDLIQQEIYHQVWDPTGLFQVIGETLKCHCAPMRDRNVEAMIQMAQSCISNKDGGSLAKAIRMCFDVLELMKLDIANHQLQSLRPFLLRSAPEYELRTFEDKRSKGQLDLSVTQKWLQTAYSQLSTAHRPNTMNPQASATIFRSLRLSMQINITVIKALIDLIFVPIAPVSFSPNSTPTIIPTPTSTSAPPSPTATSPSVIQSGNRLTPYNTVVHSMPGYPETLHLDHARMAIYTTDALDLTAMYMLMLLYRQLVFSETSGEHGPEKGRSGKKIVEAELTRLKAEIWAIAPPRLGYCFSPNWRKYGATECEAGSSSDGLNQDEHTKNKADDKEKEFGKWYKSVKDVALHVVTRAKDSGWRVAAASSPIANSKFSTLSASPPDCASTSYPGVELSPAPAPDSKMLQLVENWCDTNLQYESPLSVLLRDRLRETMLQMVMGCYHNVNCLPPPPRPSPAAVVLPAGALVPAGAVIGGSLGMECLTVEMKQIAERIAKLARIHVDVYGALYEREGFLEVGGK